MARRKIDKAALANLIRNLEGLDNEQRADLLQLLNEQKRYGLVWEDHIEDAEELLREKLPVFIEDKDKRLDKGGQDAPNHVLIEGDNLHALTALSYTHEGMVDVIYIDPPYNTGNKDFVYNDSYVDTEDGYRHSKWLSFMEKRLRIAKRLLSDRGVIFISIDDNEQANLKLLCDEVFGEENFIAKFDWRKKTGANDAKDIAVITESILLYTKNHISSIEQNIWNRDEDSVNRKRYKYSDEYIATRGKFYYDTLDRGGLQYSDSMNFGIEAPDGGTIYPNGRDSFVNDGWIWKWGKDKIKWGLENKFLEFFKSSKSKGSKYTIKYKVYELVDNEGNPRKQSGRAYSNLIIDPINQQGNSEIIEIFKGKSPFSNPKPIGLIKYFLKIINNCGIILDFFAGSGTTLHATIQLNSEDGGHRQCILVTNNENNICEEVTYERNKRVIEGYTTPKGESVEGLKNNNLRYYKTEFVGREKTSANKKELMKKSLDLLCIKEGLYQEEKTFEGLKLAEHIARYFTDGTTTPSTKQMLIIYEPAAIPVIVKRIEKMQLEGDNKLLVYVMSDGQYPFTEDFASVLGKIKLYAMPHALYQAMRQVTPTPNAEEPQEQDIEISDEEADSSIYKTDEE